MKISTESIIDNVTNIIMTIISFAILCSLAFVVLWGLKGGYGQFIDLTQGIGAIDVVTPVALIGRFILGVFALKYWWSFALYMESY